LKDVSIVPILELYLAKKVILITTTTTTTTTTMTFAPSISEQPSSLPNLPTLENIDLELALLNHIDLLIMPKINRRKMVIDDDYEVDDANNQENDNGYDVKDIDGEEQWNEKKQRKKVTLIEDNLPVDDLEDDVAR
jgi:hypothetical protein